MINMIFLDMLAGDEVLVNFDNVLYVGFHSSGAMICFKHPNDGHSFIIVKQAPSQIYHELLKNQEAQINAN